MNEHAGPACALSVLIVGVFAVLLHDKNPPPSQPASASLAAASPAVSGPAIDRGVERTTAESPRLGKTERASPDPLPQPKSSPTAEIRLAEPALRPAIAQREPSPKPLVRHAARQTPIQRRSSATIVEEGETLADVSERIYGSTDAAETIWKANRDQLAGLDSLLTAGMLLRTP